MNFFLLNLLWFQLLSLGSILGLDLSPSQNLLFWIMNVSVNQYFECSSYWFDQNFKKTKFLPRSIKQVVTCFFDPLEPSKVQNPTATHGARDDYLKVYWRHAAGDLDFYQVFIKHNNTFLQNKTVQKTQSECVFTGLVPGRLYTVLVNTWSGFYEASASTHGRTCE